MPMKLCANFDTDPDVSWCATPYEDVTNYYPRTAPFAMQALCRTCRDERNAAARTVQTGVCGRCHVPLYGGESHPQCSGFPLD